MADLFSSPGIDLPSPTLSARLRELADFLGAPTVGRLTEEQRALSLGIARRLVADVAAQLGTGGDVAALWRDWLAGGIPAAERLATACFARAEEHRWREQSAQRVAPSAPLDAGDGGEGGYAAPTGPTSDLDRAYLALQIADRRRFDGYGSPCLALPDIDRQLLRALLLDVAAWRLKRGEKDVSRGADLGEAVQTAIDRHSAASGIDRAAAAYHALLTEQADVADSAATAIARHDWPALIALASAAARRSYADMALSLLTAEAAALPILLAPLRLDRAALAPLEASLTMLAARAVASAAADGDYVALQRAYRESSGDE